MKKFAIPYNYDLDLLNQICSKYPQSVKEIYFPADLKVHSNGRADSQPNNYEEQILKIIQEAKKHEIKSNMILNGLCTGLRYTEEAEVDKLLNYLEAMVNMGLECVTLSNPLLIREIRKKFDSKDLKISVSVNSCISSVQKATYYAEFGADSFTLDCDYNKNLELIKSLHRYLQMELKIIVNQTCLPDCFMRTTHNLLVAHAGDNPDKQNVDRSCFEVCMVKNREKPWLIYSSPLIPPYGLNKYTPYVDTFKISGRDRSTQVILQILGAYAGIEEYKDYTDYYNSLIPPEVLDYIFTCAKICSNCTYCPESYKERFIENLIRFRSKQKVDGFFIQWSKPLIFPDQVKN